MENLEKLRELIEAQQKGKEGQPAYTVGLQLLDIAEREPECAELLISDLSTDGMGLTAAECKIKKYADKNRKGAAFFCVTPTVAEQILREFYGLPEARKRTEAPADDGFLSLDSFI